jgi:ABC-2 type transport system permease protein
MRKLLKADFYRLFRSKSLYWCTLVFTALLCGSAYIMHWTSTLQENSKVTIQTVSPLQDGITYGLWVFNGGDSHLFMAIFVAVFVTSEFSYGTMKNIVSKGFPRYQIYLSKLITMTASAMLMMLFAFVFTTMTATILTGKLGSFTWTFMGQIFRMLGVELLLHTALTSLFLMISMLIRNNGGAIAINIIGVISFGSLIYKGLELLFRNKIKFSEYGLRNNILLFFQNLTPPLNDIIRAVCVGIVFLIATSAIGILAFENTDVN